MSVGPLGTIGSLAGTPLSQAKGSEVEKAAQDTSDQARCREAGQRAENAAGIGRAEKGSATNERHADGRRMWEAADRTSNAEPAETPPAEPRGSQTSSGVPGNTIDLSG